MAPGKRSGVARRERSFEAAVEAASWVVGIVALIGALTFLVPELRALGIVPRTLWGLAGVVFSPLLHANVAHLAANAAPLFVLTLLLFWDRNYFPQQTLTSIWLVSGMGTWLIGRGGTLHIGASSVVYGLVAYLIVAGVLMKSWRSAGVAILVFVLYGGLIYGVFPQRGPVSWEGHLCGALAGIWAAFKNHD